MDELVKRLRECASGECFNCSQYTETTNASVCSKQLMKQAADAIEELSKHVPPVPHGRLIDADALMRHKGDCYDADGHLLYAVGTGNILCAPTIIEEER